MSNNASDNKAFSTDKALKYTRHNDYIVFRSPSIYINYLL